MMIEAIDQHRSETEYALLVLRDYLDVVEQALVRYQQEALDEINRKWENAQGSFVERTSAKIEHIVRFTYGYPGTLRYSFLMQLYVLFESRAKLLCDELRVRNPHLPLTLGDLRGGGGYFGIRTFLSKVYPVPAITKEHWDELNSFRVIRNCLIHKNGWLDPSDSDAKFLNQIISTGEGVARGVDDYLSVDRLYCDNALKLVRKIFDAIFTTASFGPSYFAGRC